MTVTKLEEINQNIFAIKQNLNKIKNYIQEEQTELSKKNQNQDRRIQKKTNNRNENTGRNRKEIFMNFL